MNAKDRMILQKIAGYIAETLLYTHGMSFTDFFGDTKTVNAASAVAFWQLRVR